MDQADIEIYNLFIITSSCIYIYIVSVFSRGIYRIIEKPSYKKTHLLAGLVFAIIGAITIFKRSEILLGDLYLFTPLMHVGLILLANEWTLHRHERNLIRAHRYNMAHEETKNASFSDYFLTISAIFLPLILPLFIFESILGKTIL